MLQIFLEVVLQLGAAFSTGLYVATSPCLFPLLPLFLIRNLQSEHSRKKSFIVTGTLILGIIISLFLFIGISTIIGYFLIQNYLAIQAVLGGILIFVGFATMSHTLREKLRLTRISMSDPGNPTSLMGVFMVGFSYSLLAAPCTGIAMLSLSLMFVAESNLLIVALMAIFLFIAVAIPYLAIALVTGEARDRMASSVANAARKIEIIVGVFLILLGFWMMYPYLLGWFYQIGLIL
ncbi:MAG: cytochrome c biogenesis protein CcdA [Candidatus Thorarchaeota archaeon]|jgi:cytochrome c biogenesis protein CcdA